MNEEPSRGEGRPIDGYGLKFDVKFGDTTVTKTLDLSVSFPPCPRLQKDYRDGLFIPLRLGAQTATPPGAGKA